MRDVRNCPACDKQHYADGPPNCDCTDEEVRAALNPVPASQVNRAARRRAEKSEVVRLRRENAELRKRLSHSAEDQT